MSDQASEKELHEKMGQLDTRVDEISIRIQAIYDEVGKLAEAFRTYACGNIGISTQKAVIERTEQPETLTNRDSMRVRDEVKDCAAAIIRADDADTILRGLRSLPENWADSVPDFCLAPCMEALSAWANDRSEPEEQALREAMRLDSMKTSLFFLLLCGRAGRQSLYGL